MSNVRRVLILCTGNSCRSQMAEGLINSLLGDTWQAFSAGVSPSEVHPLAVQVMSEIGIDISRQASKSVNDFLKRNDLDLVITVCDNARKICPVFPRQIQQLHLDFEDPASYGEQSNDRRLPRFREVRDDIRIRLISLLEST